MFTYPKPIQATKSYLQFIIFASILLTPIILFNNPIGEYSSFYDCILSLLIPYILLPLSCILYIGAWPNIKVLDNGLEIEFLWRSLFVPFKEITNANHTGSGKFGVTIVEVKAGYLTFFHRIYGLLMLKSIKPCFYIHPNIHNYNTLLKIVRQKPL